MPPPALVFLPPDGGSSEHAVVRAVAPFPVPEDCRFQPLGVDAELDVQRVALEAPEAVADPEVASVLRRAETDPRCPDDAAADRRKPSGVDGVGL